MLGFKIHSLTSFCDEQIAGGNIHIPKTL